MMSKNPLDQITSSISKPFSDCLLCVWLLPLVGPNGRYFGLAGTGGGGGWGDNCCWLFVFA